MQINILDPTLKQIYAIWTNGIWIYISPLELFLELFQQH